MKTKYILNIKKNLMVIVCKGTELTGFFIAKLFRLNNGTWIYECSRPCATKNVAINWANKLLQLN